MNATLTAIHNTEHTLISTIHTTAAALDDIGTHNLAGALENLHTAADEAKDRLAFAMADLRDTLADVLAHVNGLLAGIALAIPESNPALRGTEPGNPSSAPTASTEAASIDLAGECPGIEPRPVSLQPDAPAEPNTLSQIEGNSQSDTPCQASGKGRSQGTTLTASKGIHDADPLADPVIDLTAPVEDLEREQDKRLANVDSADVGVAPMTVSVPDAAVLTAACPSVQPADPAPLHPALDAEIAAAQAAVADLPRVLMHCPACKAEFPDVIDNGRPANCTSCLFNNACIVQLVPGAAPKTSAKKTRKGKRS